jgi:hypothetical protein
MGARRPGDGDPGFVDSIQNVTPVRFTSFPAASVTCVSSTRPGGVSRRGNLIEVD